LTRKNPPPLCRCAGQIPPGERRVLLARSVKRAARRAFPRESPSKHLARKTGFGHFVQVRAWSRNPRLPGDPSCLWSQGPQTGSSCGSAAINSSHRTRANLARTCFSHARRRARQVSNGGPAGNGLTDRPCSPTSRTTVLAQAAAPRVTAKNPRGRRPFHRADPALPALFPRFCSPVVPVASVGGPASLTVTRNREPVSGVNRPLSTPPVHPRSARNRRQPHLPRASRPPQKSRSRFPNLFTFRGVFAMNDPPPWFSNSVGRE